MMTMLENTGKAHRLHLHVQQSSVNMSFFTPLMGGLFFSGPSSLHMEYYRSMITILHTSSCATCAF